MLDSKHIRTVYGRERLVSNHLNSIGVTEGDTQTELLHAVDRAGLTR
jgi:hypothetical protein